VELGETLEQALVREVEEETGLRVRPTQVVMVFDRIQREAGEVAYHYVIIDYLCELISGTLCAASDAEAAAFVSPEALSDYELPDKALELVREGLRRAGMGADATACQAGATAANMCLERGGAA
jgi:ADP-ribose pyrophosphatase YjhB (NUDIX family)